MYIGQREGLGRLNLALPRRTYIGGSISSRYPSFSKQVILPCPFIRILPLYFATYTMAPSQPVNIPKGKEKAKSETPEKNTPPDPNRNVRLTHRLLQKLPIVCIAVAKSRDPLRIVPVVADPV